MLMGPKRSFKSGWWTVVALIATTLLVATSRGPTPLRSATASARPKGIRPGAPADSGRPEVPGPAGARAYAELDAYYRDNSREMPGAAAFDSLSARSDAARAAADDLFALYRQSLADETNGRAAWQATPYWGGGYQSAAREFRKELADRIGEEASGAHAVKIVEWGLEHERVATLQASLSQALPRLPALEAGPLIARLLTKPHPNATVLKTALGAADRLGIIVSRETLRPLCFDYRRSVRDSARSVARRAGLRNLPAFVPEQAFGGELDRVLRDVARRVKPKIPEGAAWCRIERTTKPTSPPDTLRGWLVSQTRTTLRIVDVSGMDHVLPSTGTRITHETLGDFARELIRLRASGGDVFSRMGSLTAQFESGDVALAEANVAAWCYLRAERSAAADLLLPRLDQFSLLSDFEAVVRALAGDRAHLAMLDAFSYDRDYPKAIAWGDHLAQPVFDGYAYQARGRELAAQLRERSSDFRAFSLPDSAGWDSLRRMLTRERQIGFLCERLRLINSFQWGQPGGVSLHTKQYAEASHLKRAFDEVVNRSTVLINPLVELERLKPGIQDVPALFPSLSDRRFLPTFQFWRDFDPRREMFRVGELVQGEINDIARRPLVDSDYFVGLSAREQARYRARAMEWCHDHMGRSDTDLELETLDSTNVQNVFWRTAEVLAKRGERRAASIILRRMDEFIDIRGYMIEALRMLHAVEAVPRARIWVVRPFEGMNVRWQNDADVMERFKKDTIRFQSALILLQHAEPGTHEGWPELRAMLERDREDYWVRQAAIPMLETGDPLAVDWLCKRLGAGGYRFNEMESRATYQRLLRHGCDTLMVNMLQLLSSDSVVYRTPANNREPRTFLIGDRVASIVAPLSHDTTLYTPSADDRVRAIQRARVRAWLGERWLARRGGARADTLFR